MLLDVLIAPEVECELHLGPIELTKQWLDVLLETDHECAPFASRCSTVPLRFTPRGLSLEGLHRPGHVPCEGEALCPTPGSVQGIAGPAPEPDDAGTRRWRSNRSTARCHGRRALTPRWGSPPVAARPRSLGLGSGSVRC